MKNSIKKILSQHFKLKDLGEVSLFLGMNIVHDKINNVIRINQKQYILELLQKYKLMGSKVVYTPIESGLKLKPNVENKPDVNLSI